MADSFGAAPVDGAHQIGRLVRGYLDRAIERVHCFGLVAGCRFDAAGDQICMRIFWICDNKRFGFPVVHPSRRQPGQIPSRPESVLNMRASQDFDLTSVRDR